MTRLEFTTKETGRVGFFSLDISTWACIVSSLAVLVWLFSANGPDYPEAPEPLLTIREALDLRGQKVSLPIKHPVSDRFEGPVRYQIELPPNMLGQDLGACITRWAGSGEIRRNEQLVSAPSTNEGGIINNSWGAHFVSLSDTTLKRINIDLIAGAGKPIALWPVWVGPVQKVRNACQNLDIMRRLTAGGVGLVLISFGLITLAQSYRHGDIPSRVFALVAITAAAKPLHFSIIDPPMSDSHWTLIYYCTRLLYAPLCLIFIATVIQAKRKREITCLVIGIQLFFTAVFIFSPPSQWDFIRRIQGAVYLLFAFFSAWSVRRFQRQSQTQQDVVITWLILLSIAIHAVDFYRWNTTGELYLSGAVLTTFPFLFVPITLMLMDKIGQKLASAEESARLLSAKVQAQASEIVAASLEIARVREEALVAAERRKIMRDMHDGVGSHLIGAVSLLSLQSANKPAVDMIEQALLEIRTTVDALGTESSSIDALLGSFRHRIEPILKVNGVKLDWNIDGLAEGLHIEDADKRLNLLRTIQEVFVNIIRHAYATDVSFRAVSNDGYFRCTVSDNGQGFDAQNVKYGKGLSNLEYRMNQIKGNALVSSGVFGTRIELKTPI